MRKIASTVLASTAIVGMGVAPAHAFLGAQDATDDLKSSTAYVLAGDQYCTGTVVDPSWILTAGHCVQEGTASGTATIGEKYPGTVTAWDKAVKPTDTKDDIVMLHLATKTTAKPVTLWSGEDAKAGEKATAFGWGGHAQQKFGTIQQASGVTKAERGNVTPLPEMDAIGVTFEGSNQATHGDSGGPVFVDGKLYGVFSMYTPQQTPEGQSNEGWYASVGDNAKWITGQFGAETTSDPEPSNTSNTSPTSSTSGSAVSSESTATSESTSDTSVTTSATTSETTSSTTSSAPKTTINGVMPNTNATPVADDGAVYGPKSDTGGDVESESFWDKVVSIFQ